MTTDERWTYFWNQERTAVKMAEIARDIWKDNQKMLGWYAKAERCRKEQWPKDRPYQSLYPS